MGVSGAYTSDGDDSMMTNMFDAIEKIVKKEGVYGVLVALSAVMQDVEEQELYGKEFEKQAKKWREGRNIIREAISRLPKSPGIK